MAFRLNTATLYLTYPQCPLPKEEALSQLDYLLTISYKRKLLKYMVAEEKHIDGSSHIHAFLQLNKKVNIRGANILDLTGPLGENYHGNYQGVRRSNKVLRYVMKDGNVVSNFENWELPVGTVKKSWSEAIHLAEGGDLQGAQQKVKNECPRDYLLHAPTILSALRSLIPRTTISTSGISLALYKAIPNWDVKRSLILHGQSGLGKTSLAKLLLPEALFVSHLDKLRDYDPQINKGIIFDDMSFLHLPREAQIHLVDHADERQIHCRYHAATIPAETPKIITTNKPPYEVLNVNDEAIGRRLTAWRLVRNRKGTRTKIVGVDEFF